MSIRLRADVVRRPPSWSRLAAYAPMSARMPRRQAGRHARAPTGLHPRHTSSSAATSAVSPPPVAAGALTITTGHPARLTQARATGPATGNVDAVGGAVAPSTSRSASAARSINTRATRPSASSVVTPAGVTGPNAVRTARASRARAADRSSPGLGQAGNSRIGRKLAPGTVPYVHDKKGRPPQPGFTRCPAQRRMRCRGTIHADHYPPQRDCVHSRPPGSSPSWQRRRVPLCHKVRRLPALPPATLAFPALLSKGRKSHRARSARSAPERARKGRSY